MPMLSLEPLWSLNSVMADEANTAANDMASQQCVDPKLKAIIEYLEGEELPTDERLAKRLVLESSRFTLQVFYVDTAWENSLRLAVPADSQKS